MTVYATRAEAIERAILPALGSHAADFDLDALADRVITSAPHPQRGFVPRFGTDLREFWRVIGPYTQISEPTTDAVLDEVWPDRQPPPPHPYGAEASWRYLVGVRDDINGGATPLFYIPPTDCDLTRDVFAACQMEARAAGFDSDQMIWVCARPESRYLPDGAVVWSWPVPLLATCGGNPYPSDWAVLGGYDEGSGTPFVVVAGADRWWLDGDTTYWAEGDWWLDSITALDAKAAADLAVYLRTGMDDA